MPGGILATGFRAPAGEVRARLDLLSAVGAHVAASIESPEEVCPGGVTVTPGPGRDIRAAGRAAPFPPPISREEA